MGLLLLLLPFLFFSLCRGNSGDLQAWQRTVETILTQFALASFPKEFTPAVFEEGKINQTIVLSQQRTTLRSLVYHRALSTTTDTLYIAPPTGIDAESVNAIVDELRAQGFPAWRVFDGSIFLSKKRVD